VLFVVFLILFVVSLLFGRRPPGPMALCITRFYDDCRG
jgi:hypothetical protein